MQRLVLPDEGAAGRAARAWVCGIIDDSWNSDRPEHGETGELVEGIDQVLESDAAGRRGRWRNGTLRPVLHAAKQPIGHGWEPRSPSAARIPRR